MLLPVAAFAPCVDTRYEKMLVNIHAAICFAAFVSDHRVCVGNTDDAKNVNRQFMCTRLFYFYFFLLCFVCFILPIRRQRAFNDRENANVLHMQRNQCIQALMMHFLFGTKN